MIYLLTLLWVPSFICRQIYRTLYMNKKNLYLALCFLISSASLAGTHYSNNPYCIKFKDPIDTYACLAEHAVEGIRLSYSSSGIVLKSSDIATLKAIEAMNFIQTIVSLGRYSYLSQTKSGFKPPSMQNQAICLTNGFGLCGNHQYLFIALLKRIGVMARPVDFYFTLNGIRQTHAAAEVKIGNKWVYFDISWGSYWIQKSSELLHLISIEEILAGNGIRMTENNSWYIAMEQSLMTNKLPSIFNYLKAQDLQILKNKGGLLTIPVRYNQASFSDRPNYFGKTQGNAPLKIKLTGNIKPCNAILEISGIGGDCRQSSIKIGTKHYPILNGKNKISISADTVIEIEGKDSICYAVIKKLSICH